LQESDWSMYFKMKRKDAIFTQIPIIPEVREMLRYQSYKSKKSQTYLINEILKSYLEEELSNDIHFKELANIEREGENHDRTY